MVFKCIFAFFTKLPRIRSVLPVTVLHSC